MDRKLVPKEPCCFLCFEPRSVAGRAELHHQAFILGTAKIPTVSHQTSHVPVVGLRLLVVDDPDGNQLFFNYPNETASGRIIRNEA